MYTLNGRGRVLAHLAGRPVDRLTVDIINFVPLKAINPLLFHKPYYLQVEKGGQKAMCSSGSAGEPGKVGIARVVIKARTWRRSNPRPSFCPWLMHFADDRGHGGCRPANTRSNANCPWRPSLSTACTPNGNRSLPDEAASPEKLVEKKIELGGEDGPP
jgi:DNA end-binding protein Ku